MSAALDGVTARRLFDAVRAIKGSPLLQADVDAINRALADDIAQVAKDGMRLSQTGIDLVHSFEQFRPATYKDPGGANGLPITGGWGSTVDENGKPFRLGFTAPRDYWDRLFLRDIAGMEAAVNLLVGDAPTTQAQFDALVSFAYNVGPDIDDDDKAEGLGDSTLLKRHRVGDYAGAQAQFAAWNKNDGKVMAGLVRRRAAEAALYGGKA